MIYAMSDFHLPSTSDKTMERFGWGNHVKKMEEQWPLTQEDTIIIPGDFSWGLKIEETFPDFEWLANLPGRKILLKGNHDLWWQSNSKVSSFRTDVEFIHNGYVSAEGVSICGTRGWDILSGDDKLLTREAIRLRSSLQQATDKIKIVFMHFPPILKSKDFKLFQNILHEYDVKKVYYGHLHGKSIYDAIEGDYNGIYYKLVSSDYLNFKPIIVKI